MSGYSLTENCFSRFGRFLLYSITIGNSSNSKDDSHPGTFESKVTAGDKRKSNTCVEEEKNFSKIFALAECLRIMTAEILGKTGSTLAKVVGRKNAGTGITISTFKSTPLKSCCKKDRECGNKNIQVCRQEKLIL